MAANAHNSQPWLFRVEESRIDLFADRERDIGTVDPYLREMYMSVGCALDELIGDASWQALMPFRTGYPTVEADLAPRRAVEDVLA